MNIAITRRDAARLGFGLLAGLAVAPVRAGAAEAPSPVILSVSGSIGGGAEPKPAKTFDLATLEAMPQHSFTTKTPWYSGPETFSGVLMRDIMQQVGASGSQLLVVALNDYTSEIPLDDFKRYDVILAFKRDGVYMPVSDKGPLFIVYPYDSDPALRTEKFYSRSAWQVAQFIVK